MNNDIVLALESAAAVLADLAATSVELLRRGRIGACVSSRARRGPRRASVGQGGDFRRYCASRAPQRRVSTAPQVDPRDNRRDACPRSRLSDPLGAA